MYILVFPAWEPDSNDVLCSKFLYFYRTRCFDPQIEDIQRKIIGEKGAKRLQGAKLKNVFLYVIQFLRVILFLQSHVMDWYRHCQDVCSILITCVH